MADALIVVNTRKCNDGDIATVLLTPVNITRTGVINNNRASITFTEAELSGVTLVEASATVQSANGDAGPVVTQGAKVSTTVTDPRFISQSTAPTKTTCVFEVELTEAAPLRIRYWPTNDAAAVLYGNEEKSYTYASHRQTLRGLAPGVDYSFQIELQANNIATWEPAGPIETFTTEAQPVSLVTSGDDPKWPARISYRPTYAQDTRKNSDAPRIGGGWFDEPFGTQTKRVLDLDNAGGSAYATKNVWNKDGTILWEQDVLIDAESGEIIKKITQLNSERQMSHEHNKGMFGCSGSEFRFWDFGNDTLDVLRDFGAPISMGVNEGNISITSSGQDGRVALTTPTEIITYDIQSDTIINTTARPPGMDNIGFAPSGENLISRDGAFYRMDPDFGNKQMIAPFGAHADRGSLADGSDVLITVAKNSKSPYQGVHVFHMDGTCTAVVDPDDMLTYRGNIAHHICARMDQKPGFCGVSGYVPHGYKTQRSSVALIVDLARSSVQLDGSWNKQNGVVKDVYRGVDKPFIPMGYTRAVYEAHDSNNAGRNYNHNAAKFKVNRDGTKASYVSTYYNKLENASLFVTKVK